MNPTTESPTAQTPPVISSVRGSFSDFDALAAAARGWGLDWIQLDRGPLVARFQQVETPSALVSRFAFSRKFHQRGTIPPGMRTFGMIAPLSPNFEWRGKEGTPQHLIVFPSNDEFEFISHPEFHGDTLSVPEQRLRQVADTLGLPDLLDEMVEGQALLHADPRHIEEFRWRLTELYTLGARNDGSGFDGSVLADAEFNAIASLVTTLASGAKASHRVPEPGLRARALRLAVKYIADHAAEPPTVEQICRASGASWRTLDYAFRVQFDLTPKQYLETVRLQMVRRDLLGKSSGNSISEIAAGWGFWHRGQFAAVYRRQFGELPSETVQRT